METLLYQYNPWWEEHYEFANLIKRDSYLAFLSGHIDNRYIIFLTGLRRVGKTSLLKLVIRKLIEDGIDPNYILYVSVDDYMLIDKTLEDILFEFRKLKKIKTEEKVYVFFDEITVVNNYQLQLKNLYDKYPLKIFATASSSSLLRDTKALLTGRSVTREVGPLDFNEFKTFRKIEILKRDEQLNDAYFMDYLRIGGVPEHVLNPDREYLMNLIDQIIQKDITAHYGLKNNRLVRDFFTLLMERSGKQLSINKIANILKISPDTARRYLGYFEDTFLIHLVTRWGKTNERLLAPRKVYACDLGIKYLFTGERDLGSYFENYVYLKLRNKKELFYLYEEGIEIDFLTSDQLIIESKFNSKMTDKQQELFDRYPATGKLVIDSVKKLELLEAL